MIKWQSNQNTCSCIVVSLPVISLDSSRCRNSQMNLTFLPITSLSHWDSVGLAKILTSWWGLKGTYRNSKKRLGEQKSERGRLIVRTIFSMLIFKLISGCASGTQLSSWGSTGALLWPPYIGFSLKTNCKDRMDHSHTLLCIWIRTQPENS